MFPYVASYNKPEWNSQNCGKCLKLAYKNRVIYVTIIDQIKNNAAALRNSAFNLSKESF